MNETLFDLCENLAKHENPELIKQLRRQKLEEHVLDCDLAWIEKKKKRLEKAERKRLKKLL